MPERLVIVPEQDGERLDKALTGLMPGTSRATLQRWISEGRVTLNGGSCRARDAVRQGDIVVVERAPPPPSRAVPDPSVTVVIVYGDEDLVVVNKPAGLVVHPARGHWTGTLVNGLLATADFGMPPADPLDPEGAMRPGIVHRIDKETSGLLVVAKTDVAREALKEQLAAHSVERVYQAITLGTPKSGRIETLHSRHPHSRLKFTSLTKRGKRAVTQVDVVEVFGDRAAALVECRLETGRTHQIRVHLAEQAGHPILADALYGRRCEGVALESIESGLGRQALHAGVLGFIHPTTGQELRFEVPPPDDMLRALEQLRELPSSGTHRPRRS